ncbi:GNAT family N-acetyltransferase [Lysobacter firmicutimachus]|uniref:GNAT family N-acetyltransferase n=1 Tax=Lysobacter firmicutimachus TaxID=1792846 RepID=A0AAU8MTX1_9GAMM
MSSPPAFPTAPPPATADAPVRVVAVDAALAPAVRALQVAPEQWPFVGDASANLDQAWADPASEAMAILAGERVVGFYRLDFATAAIAGRAFAEPSVGLRSYVIDRDAQGRGYGRAAIAACRDDVRRRHPQRRLLALTVNVRNAAAIAAYRKAGFADTGELYLGGNAGPQHLMLLRLQPAADPSSPDPVRDAP